MIVLRAKKEHAETINKVLENRGIVERIDENDLFILPINNNLAINNNLPVLNTNNETGEKLRKIVEDYIWEVVEEGTFLYHFTHESVGKIIENSNIIRQYNILKRLGDGEIRDFFNYYGIKNFYPEHYEDKFYISFTKKIPNTIERIMKFSAFTRKEKEGVRLTFRVNKRDEFFRYIDYTKDKLSILKELREAILTNHNMHFNISGITTRLAAYYVNEQYSDEFEVRYYTHAIDKSKILTEPHICPFSYIEMLFDSNKRPVDNALLTLIDITYERKSPIFDEVLN